MRKKLCTNAARPGVVAVEGLSVVTMLVGAAAGGWLVYQVPGMHSSATAATAGVFGLFLALGVQDFLESFLGSLRALTRTPSSPADELTTEEKKELPSNADDVLELLAEAARSGAAHQAAVYSGKVDPAQTLLDKPELWIGVDGTTALFRLADGAYVYYEVDESGKYPKHEYSFVAPETGDAPVPVTSMEQVRDLMAQYVSREREDASAAV